MASALIYGLKAVLTEIKRSQLEDEVSASWAALAAKENHQKRGTGTLLVEAGAGEGGEGRQREGGEYNNENIRRVR